MGHLPVVSGEQVVKALLCAGFERNRQKGSHVAMVRRTPPVTTITVPMHREVAWGTLRKIIRDAGLTVDEFVRLLD